VRHSRFDSEYDRVRREAGFAKPKYEFPEEDEPDQKGQVTSDRVKAMNEDFQHRMSELANHERQKTAEADANHARRRREFDEKVIRREYEALGLKPPEPLVSLSLLRSMGWRVDVTEFGGESRAELTHVYRS
jgi:hypothetical protein